MKKSTNYGFMAITTYLMILLTISVSTVIIFVSCSKNSGEKLAQLPNSITILSQRQATQSVSNSIFDDHIILAELIGFNNKTLDTLKKGKIWNTLDLSKLDLTQIHEYFYDNSSISTICIPYKDDDNNAIAIYSYKGGFIYCNIHSAKVTNGNIEYSVNSLVNKDLYYKYEQNSAGKLGNFVFQNKIYFSNFKIQSTPNIQALSVDLENGWDGTNYYNNVVVKPTPLIQNHTFTLGPPTCPAQFPKDMNKCMDCATAECSNSWLCAAACASGGLTTVAACLIGFALACSGVVAS